jgi:hypothetical protein
MRRGLQQFLIPFGILTVVLVGYNAVIHVMAGQSDRRQLLSALEQMPRTTDCLFLGNSLVEAGCDATAFKTAWPDQNNAPSAFNLALGGTSPVEHCLILEKALRRPLRPKYLVYGFFDDQLSAPVRGGWTDLVGNRAFSYYFPKEAAAFYAPESWSAMWRLRIIGHVPMLAERSSVWGKVELLRRVIEEIGMPKQKINRFGRAKDFAALEPKDITSFNERCEEALQKGFTAPVERIIDLAKRHGAKVVLVEMPLPSRHRETFYASPVWPRMRSHLQTLAAQREAIYISASDWVKDDNNFEDATHLTKEGAQLFSRQLAVALARTTAGGSLALDGLSFADNGRELRQVPGLEAVGL